MQDERVLPYSKEGFLLPTPSELQEIIENANHYVC